MNTLNITLLLFTFLKCCLFLLHYLDDGVLHLLKNKLRSFTITDEDRMHTYVVGFIEQLIIFTLKFHVDSE